MIINFKMPYVIGAIYEIPFRFLRNLFFLTLIIHPVSEAFSQQKRLSVNSCPSISSRNNGNGRYELAAGDFTPNYSQNNPVAANVVGTPYQKVPYEPRAKTGNVVFAWSSSIYPANLPVITRVWLTSTGNVTSLSNIKFGPPPPPLLTGGKYVVNYNFYYQNMPPAGKVTFEFADPVTGLVAFRCTYNITDNKSSTPVPVDCTPTVIKDPKSVITECGTNNEVTFSAEGTGAASTVWQKSTNGGSSWSDITLTGDYSATQVSGTTTLSVENSLAHDGEWYRVNFIGGTGCGSAQTKAAILFSKPNPTAAIQNSSSYCGLNQQVNIPVTLTGTAPWTISYNKTTAVGTTPITVTTSQNPYIISETPTVATTYTLTSVKDQFCTASAPSSNHIFNVYPVPTVALGTSPTVCFGTTDVSLSYSNPTGTPNQYSIATGIRSMTGFTAVTNASLGSTVISVAIPANTAAGTYDFNLTVKNSTSGCVSAVYPFTITIQSPPYITASSSVATVCAGTKANLLAAPIFSSYAWRIKGTTTVISTLPNPSVNPATTTTYEVIGTDAFGCTAIAETTITVVPAPTVNVSPLSGSICEGGSLILSASGGVSYSWSPATGLSANQGPAVVASPTATTTYTVTAASALGCTATATATVNVNTITMSLTSSKPIICTGESSQLVANVTGAGATYLWYPLTGLFTDAACTIAYTGATSVGTVYAKPSATTTYYVRGAISGCEETQSTTVTIQPLPINTAISVGNSYTFCSSSTSNFSLPVNLTSPVTSAVWSYSTSSTGTYTNLNSGNTTLTGQSAVTFNVSSSIDGLTQTLGVSGYNTGRYTGPRFLKLTIQTALCNFVYPVTLYDIKGSNTEVPVITAERTTICSGESTTLNIGGLGTGVTVKWQSSSTAGGPYADISGETASSYNTGPLTNTSNRFFQVVINSTGTGNCTFTTGETEITILSASPVNTITPTSVCSDNTNSITLNGSTESTATFLWEKSIDNINFAPIISATSEDYTLPFKTVPVTSFYRRVLSIASCPNQASAATIVYAPLTNDYITTPTSIYCGTAPQGIVLTGSTIAGGTGTYAYQWQESTDGLSWTNIINATSKDLATPSSQTVDRWYKRITSSTGCSNTSESIIVIRVNPGASVITINSPTTSICSGESLTLSATSASDPLNYTWSPTTELSATTGFKLVASPTASRTYTVTGVTNNGCSLTQTVNITVTTSPAVPVLTTSSASICSGVSYNLNGLTNPGTTEWYSAPEKNSAYQVSSPGAIAEAGTYYAFSKTGSCYSTTFSTFTLTVDDISKPAVNATDYNGCSNADLTLLQPAPRTGVVYRWHTVASSPSAGNQVATPSSVGSGTYYLYAFSTLGNCYGVASDPVTVTVTTAITATVSSTAVTKCAPETVDLTALNSTTNSGTTIFKWYTQPTIDPEKLEEFPNQISVSGTYYQIPITNGCVGTASAAVTVTINPKPEVSVSNLELICSSTSPVSITATITNTVSSPAYQWQTSSDGVTWTNLSNGGVYSGVTTSVLGISNPSTLNGVSYRAVVTSNSCETSSDAVTIVIEPVPAFSTQPTDVSIGLGGTATFQSVINDDGTSVFQWQVSTDGGTTFADLLEEQPYSGVNTETLTVVNGIAEQNGYVFRIKVTNSCQDYYSANAVLRILSNPNWTVTKNVSSPNYAGVGDVLNYSITVENTGDVNIGNVTISDPDADSPGAVRGQDLTGDNDAVLEVGEKWYYTASHTITQADITAGRFTNTATASGTPSFGNLPNKSASSTSCAIPVLSGNQNVCVGSTTTLTSTGTPAASGAWSSSNTSVVAINSSGVVTGVAQGTATITFTTLYGCTATRTITVNTLPAAPVVSLVQPTCTTATGSIVVTGVTGLEYSIDGASYSTTTTFTGLNPGTYSVTAKNINGCISSVVSVVISNPPGAPDIPIFSASATTICSGVNTTLTVTNGNANQTYQWLKDAVEISGATGQTYSTNVAGVYTVKATNGSGCTAVSAGTTITVNPIPTVSINQGSALELNCDNGSSLTLSGVINPGAPAPSAYKWYSVNTAVTPNTETQVATTSAYSVTTSGTYLLEVTVNGCTGRSNAVEVSQAPQVNSPTSTQICEGQQFTLTASSAGTWFFSANNTTYTEVAASASTYNATAAGYYKIGNSCPVQVIVNSNPIVTLSISSTQICSGQSATLGSTVSTPNSSNNTYQYQWYRDGNLINAATSSTYTATLGGQYTLKVTNNNGCSTTSSAATINVVNNPVLVVTSPAAVCAPGKLDLTANAVTSGSTTNTTITYWTDAAATQTLSNPSQITASGTYYLKLTDQNGCSSTVQSVAATINAAPVFTVTASTSVCAPAVVDLTTLVSSNQNLSYSFYSDGAGTNLIGDATQISNSGTYYAKGTTVTGCGELKAIAVVVNPAPMISGSFTVCAGGATNLTATGTPANQSPWTSSDVSIATVSSSGVVTGVAEGTVTITYTNSVGCTDQISVTVNALPVVTGPTAVCDDSTITLIGNGTPAASNAWVSSNPFIATVGSSGLVTAVSPGVANITYTNISGCAVTYAVTVQSRPAKPVVELTQPSCTIATGTISISTPVGSGLTYSIDNTNYAASTTFNSLTPGSYTVTAKNSNGCVSLVTTSVINAPLTAPSAPVVTATGSTTVCSGENVTLNSTSATSYQWYQDGVLIVGSTSQSYVTNLSGSYTVEITNGSGCKATSAPVTITVNPIPVVTITQTLNSSQGSTLALSCNSSTLQLTANLTSNADNVTYEWFKDGQTIPGANTSTYSATSAGNYSVKVTANSCSSLSNVVTVIGVPSVTGSGSETNICQGQVFTLNASGGTFILPSYQWQLSVDGTNWNDITTGVFNQSSYNATATGFYRAKVTDGSSNAVGFTCPSKVIVNPKPVVTIDAGSGLACEGSSVNISSNVTVSNGTPFTYGWTKNGISLFGATSSTYAASTSGNYALKVTDTKGCSGVSSSKAVTINVIPQLVVNDPAEVCQPETINITGLEITDGSILPVGTSLTYWTDSNASNALTDPSEISAVGTTTYYIKATSPSGCFVIKPVEVTINSRPANAVFTSTQPSCTVPTGSVIVTFPVGQGLTYSLDAVNYSASATFSSVTTGNYLVYAKNAFGCVSVGQPVTINRQPSTPARPVVAAEPDDSVCEGQSITLISSATTGNQWYKDGILIAGANLQSFTASASGSYTVRVTNTSGCTSIASVARTLTFDDQPVVTIVQNSQLSLSCDLPSVLLEADVAPAGNYTFQWFKNGVPVSGATFSSYSATSAGEYLVRATSSTNQCSNNSDDITVLAPITTNSSRSEICEGESITLSGSVPPGFTNVSYQWQKKIGSGNYVGATGSGSQSLNFVVGPANYSTTETNFYRVVITGTLNGSPVSATTCPTELIVNLNPTNVSVSGSATLCSGNPGLLSASANGSGTFNYQWKNGSGNDINGATANQILVSVSDNYEVVVTNASGCSASASKIITVSETPELELISPDPVCSPSTIDLTDPELRAGSILPSGTVLSYLTNLSGTVLSTPSAVTTSGTYYIKATNSNCTDIAPLIVAVDPIPVLTITNPPAICAPSTIDLTAESITEGSTIPFGTTLTYWQDAAATIEVADPEKITTAGTYYIKAVSLAGCSDIEPVTLTFTNTSNDAPDLIITNPAAVCAPSTVDLTDESVTTGSTLSNPVYSYWTNSGATTALSSPSTVSTSGTYYVKVVDQGCTQIKPVVVSVKARPSAPAVTVAEAIICSGQTSNISVRPASGVPADFSYSWTVPNGVTAPGNVQSFSASAQGTYAVVITNNSTLCSSPSANSQLTVNSNPTIDGSALVCAGQTTALSGSGTAAANNAWVSSDPNIAIISSSGEVTGITAGTAVITYTNNGGCSATKTVTVNGSEVVSGTTTVCIGGTTTLTGTGNAAANNAWSSSNSSVATVSSSGVVTGFAAGTAIITYTNSSGCTGTATVAVNPSASISGTTTVCAGSTTTLLGTGNAAANSPWTSSDPSVALVTSAGEVTGISAGTATITYTNSSGCTTSTVVTVNSLPSISGSTTVCAGGTTTLTGTGTPADAGAWSSSNITVASVSSTGIVTGVSAGSAIITYRNSSGCSASANLTISASSSLGGSTSVCVGSTSTLTGSGNPATNSPWTTSDPSVATISSTGVVSGLTEGTTVITYTNASGCTATATVTVLASPTVSGLNSVCAGQSITLLGSGTPADINAWASSNTGIAVVSTSGVVTGLTSGTVNITYTNSNGCTTSTTIDVSAPVTISGTTTVCAGLTTTLTGSGTAATTNSWVSSDSGVATVSSTGVVTGVSVGTATITYTNSSGCSTTAQITVNLSPEITGESGVCIGQTITLTGSGKPASANAWSSSSTNIATVSPTGEVTGIAAGTTVITYTNNVGCQKTKTITVNAPPQAPGTITGTLQVERNTTNVYQVNPVAGAASYIWTVPSGWTGSSTLNSIVVTVNDTDGILQVRAVSAAGCISPIASTTIVIRSYPIKANDDDYRPRTIISSRGGTLGPIFGNDTFDGKPITGPLVSQITVKLVNADGIIGLAIDNSGNLIVPPKTPVGIYQIIYRICEAAKPNNCSEATISIEIIDSNINVPEGISPQGDNKNDLWIIKGLDNYPNHNLKVFNRWGNLVYEASPYKNDWDGRSRNGLTVNGDDRLPAGTYYWVIELFEADQSYRLSGYLFIAY